jgi:hypothetical protein
LSKKLKRWVRWNPGDNFTVAKWIETPSDHYTSYRVIVSPVAVLAAGLLYSRHTKDHRKERVPAHDPFDEHSRVTTVPAILDCFEDPRSPYFLNSRAIASNVSRGGRCIPLMGDNRRTLTAGEEIILDAHGIDRTQPSLPEHVRRPAMAVARQVGRTVGLVAGLDFLHDAGQLDTSQFLEFNTFPGFATWNECCNGGAAGATWEEASLQMHRSALHSIAKVS